MELLNPVPVTVYLQEKGQEKLTPSPYSPLFHCPHPLTKRAHRWGTSCTLGSIRSLLVNYRLFWLIHFFIPIGFFLCYCTQRSTFMVHNLLVVTLVYNVCCVDRLCSWYFVCLYYTSRTCGSVLGTFINSVSFVKLIPLHKSRPWLQKREKVCSYPSKYDTTCTFLLLVAYHCILSPVS